MKQRLRRFLLEAAGSAFTHEAESSVGLPARVLVIRPDHMGDLLLSIPSLRLLRQRLPAAHITLLIGPWNSEIAAHIPYIDEVLTFPFPWFDRKPKSAPWRPYTELRRAALMLRPYRFDLAVLLRHDHWWGAWCAALADIPKRAGYDVPEISPFLTQRIPYRPQHESEQCLALVQAALPETMPVPDTLASIDFALADDERAFADTWLTEHAASGDTLIALHPGAGAPVKQWPPERFGRLARALASDHRAHIVVTGNQSEASLVQYVIDSSDGAPMTPLIGATLGQVAAVLQRCRLAVGGDAGILHLAAAVGTPTVRLYGPVDLARFGPLGAPEAQRVVRADLTCTPCNRLDYPAAELPFHPCVRSITLDAVLEAVHPMLKPLAVA